MCYMMSKEGYGGDSPHIGLRTLCFSFPISIPRYGAQICRVLPSSEFPTLRSTRRSSSFQRNGGQTERTIFRRRLMSIHNVLRVETSVKEDFK
jgi:hypothetical protein